MRTWYRRLGLALLAGLLAVTVGRAAEEEKKIPLSEVPAAVRDAVKAKYPGAELTGAEKETEKGVTYYELAFKDKGQRIEATFKADGTLVSVEKVIAVKDLPRAVADALDAKYRGAKLTRVEEETEGDKVTYEVHLVTAEGKAREVVFDRTGKVVEEESKDKK